MEFMGSEQKHLDALMQRRPELLACRPALEQAFNLQLAALGSGKKLMLCGNGGSAADSEHWAGELLKGFCHKRPLDQKLQAQLGPEMGAKLQCGLPAIPLTSFLSANSAFANDVDPTLIYAQLVCALGRPGDVLIGLSTSGNSQNIIAAFKVARAKQIKTLALTARGGGALALLADVAIKAPADETHIAQEYHVPIYHCLSLMLEEAFFVNPAQD